MSNAVETYTADSAADENAASNAAADLTDRQLLNILVEQVAAIQAEIAAVRELAGEAVKSIEPMLNSPMLKLALKTLR